MNKSEAMSAYFAAFGALPNVNDFGISEATYVAALSAAVERKSKLTDDEVAQLNRNAPAEAGVLY